MISVVLPLDQFSNVKNEPEYVSPVSGPLLYVILSLFTGISETSMDNLVSSSWHNI